MTKYCKIIKIDVKSIFTNCYLFLRQKKISTRNMFKGYNEKWNVKNIAFDWIWLTIWHVPGMLNVLNGLLFHVGIRLTRN